MEVLHSAAAAFAALPPLLSAGLAQPAALAALAALAARAAAARASAIGGGGCSRADGQWVGCRLFTGVIGEGGLAAGYCQRRRR